MHCSGDEGMQPGSTRGYSDTTARGNVHICDTMLVCARKQVLDAVFICLAVARQQSIPRSIHD